GERRTAGQDHALHARKGLDRILRLANFSQHALPPDFCRDQVRVLAAEIDVAPALVAAALNVVTPCARAELQRSAIWSYCGFKSVKRSVTAVPALRSM